MKKTIGKYQLNTIVTGDARLLSEGLPDNCIDLILCDPIYQNVEDYLWLAQTAKRVLRPEGALLAFFGIGYIEDTLRALREGGMAHRWICAVFVPGAGSRVAKNAFGNWQALAWCGGGPRRHLCDAVISHTATLTGTHRWKKNLVPLAKYISWFTDEGDVVWDPFCGGGSVPCCCVTLNRGFLAFEVDGQIAQEARERVADTSPLFRVEQLSFESDK